MARISLGNGRWFNDDKATRWDESTTWNGNNHISNATGSQWEHERMYRTAKGTFVLYAWSQWQGSIPSYRELDKDSAYRWLISQGHADEVPATYLKAQEV